MIKVYCETLQVMKINSLLNAKIVNLLKAGPPPWFEFSVIFDFFAPWNRRDWEASSVKIL